MGSDRQGPKNGRYGGGFLQFFDWNAKSRKKLFNSKSDLSEHSKQGKQGQGNFPTTRIHMVDEDEIGGVTSVKGSSDYSCASSVTDEEGYGSKAPGVVARLMGLDSLPTSSAFSDTQSLQEEDLNLFQRHQMVHSRSFSETQSQRVLRRPMEKFQTEILPPKSAKSVPITHNRLLSPIKNPGFVPSKDAAHIMEAAAKIIDPRPQGSARTRMSLGGSSPVTLKVRELKEKMEASQRGRVEAETSRKLPRLSEVPNRTLESNAARSLKGQPMNKSWNGSVGSSSKASGGSDDSSVGVKNKGKSISLAIQAKVNVQRRESLNLSRKNMEGVKEEDVSKQSQTSKSETRKKSAMLRENNRRQNCSVTKENVSSKSSAAGKKVVNGDSAFGRQRNPHKDAGSSGAGSRKSNLDSHRDVSLNTTRNVPRKRRSIDGNAQDERNEKLSEADTVEESRKKGSDVVSFTFTTPMGRSVGGFELPKQLIAEGSNSLYADKRNKKGMGFDIVGDSLSALLEQKLRELSVGNEPSKLNFLKEEASSSSTSDRQSSITFSSVEPEELKTGYNPQGRREVDECSSSKAEARKQYNYRHQSPVSVMDLSGLSESCNSSDSMASNVTEESKQQCSSVQGQELVQETEMDLSDSATSFSSSTDWELCYIKDILCNIESMFNDYTYGRTHEIINPRLFDELESKRGGSSSCRRERKALFECVSEFLDWRGRRFVNGGFRAWEKGMAMAKSGRLAEELYNEIQAWRRMRDSNVDELVDKDMGVMPGRWQEFEADKFEIVVDIEARILNNLVDEMVADILPYGGGSSRSRRTAFMLRL